MTELITILTESSGQLLAALNPIFLKNTSHSAPKRFLERCATVRSLKNEYIIYTCFKKTYESIFFNQGIWSWTWQFFFFFEIKLYCLEYIKNDNKLIGIQRYVDRNGIGHRFEYSLMLLTDNGWFTMEKSPLHSIIITTRLLRSITWVGCLVRCLRRIFSIHKQQLSNVKYTK